MFKKIALAGMIALSSQLQVYAANCALPQVHTDWHPDWGDWQTKFCQDSQVPNSICVIKWKGLGWWTAFHTRDDGFFEAGQAYGPQNVTVKDNKLELKVVKRDLGGGTTWTAAEAVLVSGLDDQPINIGYGDYLFTVENPEPFGQLDRALVFGAFTYLRDDDGSSNPHKELDMVEISQWGYTGQGACPWGKSDFMSNFACHGSFQMGSQPWEQDGALQRFPLKAGDPDILDQTKVTYYMSWNAGSPVKYKTFRGAVDMRTAQSQPGDIANYEMKQLDFVPKPDACVRFHFNFYLAINSKGRNNINLEPQKAETVIYITNFEYQPK